MQKRKTLTIAILLILVIMAGVGLYWFDPVHYALMPQCPFRLLTGWSCPGCGLQRAIHALLHGHLWEAYSYNFFFIISIPYALGLCWANWGWPHRLRVYLLEKLENRYVIHTYCVLFMAWWVIRNLLDI